MKPLIVLLSVFALLLACAKLFTGNYHLLLAGNGAMSAMLVLTSIGHFAFRRGMLLMMPPSFPFKLGMIYLTGLLELAAAAGLLIPEIRHLTANLLILLFLIMLPANIEAARKRVDFQKATFDGKGPAYLWFRIPLQCFFIAWVAYFGLAQG